MPGMFRVTYQTVTPESAEIGDFEEIGFAAPGGWRHPIAQCEKTDDHNMTLREALGICSPSYDCGRWFSSESETLDYRTGEDIAYSIHPPHSVTATSYARLRRLMNV